ncbi:uncharacterized protein LOC113321717 [Papaver somniferum]|uniref:uncharacterized protein LOC113321717 n=1 Tax=Papaver somniferum TaxID=3469 RepID=UPI000E6F4B7A|nr:uncharacterized protein LOC113321717 [Papaver somniferum]
MLSSLRRIGSRKRNFNGGNSATIHFSPFIYTQKNPSLLISIIRFSSSPPNHKNSSISSSFVVHYLINSCGLSEHQAITASKTVNFTTSTNPDSVLDLLENHGFTKPYISKLITWYPKILKFGIQKNLKPKFDFFKSKGLSGIDLAEFFLSCNPRVLETSLQDKIIPCCDALKNIVQFDKNVIVIIRRHPWLLTGSVYLKNLMVNIELLGDEGVPQSNVSNFLMNQPSSLTISTTKFEEIVQQIKGMGFDPSKAAFLRGLQGLTAMTKPTWELKVNAYGKWGWTEDDIQNAFRKHPQCMMLSEKKIMSTMDFLVNQMGYNPSSMAKWPAIFSYSLEKRIIPRCSVYKILTSKGMVKDKIALITFLSLSDESFLKKFVIKFEVEVPELLKLYPSAVKSRAT